MITDVNLLLNEFLGDEFAQSVTAEMGQGVIGMGSMSGFLACHQLLLSDRNTDHPKLANEIEDAIEGLLIAPGDEPEWETIEGYEEK